MRVKMADGRTAWVGPRLERLDNWALYDLLDIARRNPGAFSDWEQDFCESICERIEQWGDRWFGLSPAQARVLEKGLLYRLWDNDPALWPSTADPPRSPQEPSVEAMMDFVSWLQDVVNPFTGERPAGLRWPKRSAGHGEIEGGRCVGV